MKRLALLSLLLLLAACSGHTIHRIEVDLLSFIPQNQRQGELDLIEAQVRLPDDPAGQLVEVPGAEALVDGRLAIGVKLKNTGTTNASLSLDVRMGPGSDNDLYDDNQGDISATSKEVDLAPGQETEATLTLDLQPNTQAFNLVKSGRFRIGVKISMSGERVQYTLTQADVLLRLKLFNLIPNP